MSKNDIYKITILNWDKYNKNLKKGHKCILLSTGFLDDAKIKSLPQGGRLLYLSMLLACGEVTSSSIEATHEQLVSYAGGSGQRVLRLIEHMQSLQLLTYIKIESFLNRIEKKRIEEKGKEKKLRKGGEDFETASLFPMEKPIGKVLMARYCELWKSRYGINPTVQKHHPKMLKDVGEQNGKGRTLELLDAYFQAPDSFFVKRRHDVQTFISNLAPLTSFLESGKMVSNNEIRQMDSSVSTMNTLDALRRGEI